MEHKETGSKNIRGILLAFFAASCYALSSPLSKLLLDTLAPTLLSGFLYLGAGLCMAFLALFRLLFRKGRQKERRLTGKDLPYVVGMVLLDIAAPILLMYGLERSTAESAALLNNFEIVATALLAFLFFKERIAPRLWAGIVLITLSCLLLSFESLEAFDFSVGSLLILAACCCWGLENNCTRRIADADPGETVLIKGLFSGSGSLAIGFAIGERLTVESVPSILYALLLGVVAYGLSIFLYIYAQRFIGAARTSAYYAVNPFIAVLLSFLLFRNVPHYTYWIALVLMAIGAFLSSSDRRLFPSIRKKKPSDGEGKKP